MSVVYYFVIILHHSEKIFKNVLLNLLHLNSCLIIELYAVI